MAEVQIVDLDPKLSPDGTELVEIQESGGGGPGTSFHTPLSNLIGPQGPQGDPGEDGTSATATAGTTTTLAPGADATVVNSGTTTDAVFDFGIPEGVKGDQGDKGDAGDPGAAATADAGTTTTLAPGSNATVVNVGTTAAAVFDFGIPRGDKGDKGDQGDPGTGYNLIGSATVAALNATNSTDHNVGDAYLMLDAGTVQPTGAAQGTAVVTDDLIVWGADSYFVNYGGQSGGATDHGALTGLLDDDHTQYHNDTRGDARYYTKAASDANYATAAQGTKADSATQPGDNVSDLTNDAGYITGLANLDDIGDVTITAGVNDQVLTLEAGVWVNKTPASGVTDHGLLNGLADDDHTQYHTDARGDVRYYPRSEADSTFATAAQGALADTATQPGDNVSTLTNDSGYITGLANLDDIGDVTIVTPVDDQVLTLEGGVWKNKTAASGVTDHGALNGLGDDDHTQYHTDARGDARYYTQSAADAAFATASQGALADTATQPGDNVSTLTNDAGYKAYYSGASLPDPAGYADGDLFMVIT
jgi:hypothetical protein